MNRARIALAVTLLVMGCVRRNPVGTDQAPPETNRLDSSPSVVFTDVAAQSGVNFTHAAYGAGDYFFPAVMAPGGAFLDFDRDGRLDVLLVNGAPVSGEYGQSTRHFGAASPTRGNRLFHQDADGRFVDATAESGLDLELYGMGAAVGDVNNDGYPDVYLSAFGHDRLFLNQCDGAFRDITAEAGIDNPRWGASAAFFDFDRDGWLDLFVTNYVDYDPAQLCHGAGGRADFCNPAVFPPTADKLYRNVTGETAGNAAVEGNARLPRFEDISLSTGIARKAGAGLGVLCADFTGDGWQDVYVANDGHANFLWVNGRDGTFRDEAVLLAAAYDGLGRGQGSMGIALGDVNQDERDDLLVTNLEGENNALYLALREGGFQEGSAAAGLGSSFPATGFGVCLFDLENDGDLDLFVANGRVRRSTLSETPTSGGENDFWRTYVERNAILLNSDGGKFESWKSPDDPFLSQPGVSRALAQGDIDNDGDYDLLITQSGGPARLLRNDSSRSGHWLMVRAVDPRYGGRDMYGAVVTVDAGGKRWRRTVSPCASYLATHDPRLHFGLGAAERVNAINVTWPDGAVETFPGGPADEFRTLEYGSGASP
jgi:hypothetical protein